MAAEEASNPRRSSAPMAYFNPLVAGLFVGLMAIGYAYFLSASRRGSAMAAANSY